MKAVRGLVAGLVTLLLCWSTAASVPTAAAATDPVTATVGCGYVDVQNVSGDEVGVMYGDPHRNKADGFVWLASNATKHITTKRTQFAFLVLDSGETQLLQKSGILRPQNCAKVTAKTPKITGKVRVGEALTATTTGWGPVGIQLSYQWYRSGKKVSGATASTYTLTKTDKGKKITVKVAGALQGYFSVSKTSKATAKVKAGVLSPAPVPTIDGPAVVGLTLTANPGIWGPAAVKLSYQWYRSGKKVNKATQITYTLTKSDLGKKITVKVTGTQSGYNKAVKASAPTLQVVLASD
jgi:hypothetical protein